MALDILNPADTDNVSIITGDLPGHPRNMAILSNAGIDLHNIPSSQDLTGIELRIKSIWIKNNRQPRVWPFPGKANLYLVSIVAGDIANQMIQPVNVQACDKVGDDEPLRYSNSTIYLYQQDNEHAVCPSQLHVVLSVIKSKKGLRKVGEILQDLKSDTQYSGLIGKITDVAGASTPVTAVMDIVRDLGNIVGKHLGEVEDQPLASMMRSFTGIAGDWDKLGVNPVPVSRENVNFNLELIIRNKGKEAALAQATRR